MIVKESPENYIDESTSLDTKLQFRMPRIKDMDKDDTPRERAEKFGCSVLSVADLWALILRTGTVGMPITELCREIMRQNDNNLNTLERRTRKELLQIKGLGKLKALQIEAVMELIRRYNIERLSDNPIVKSASDVFDAMRYVIGNLPHEEVWILILNRKSQIVKRFRASKGGFSSSLFDVKTIIKEALLENASSIILCHNHPSGQTNPSPQDDSITLRCKAACEAVEIKMLDHLIIALNDYYSYADMGKI